MNEEISKTFEVGAGCHVDVQNIRGSITIEGWDKPEVHILVRKHESSSHAAEMTDIEIGQDGDEVWVRTHVKSGGDWLGWLGGKRPVAVDYVLKVPYQSKVSTSMVDGPTKVQGVHGELKLNTVSGDARLQDVEGEISLNTVSGEIEATEIKGDVKLHAVSGDVGFRASHLKSLRGNTVSGDVKAETPLSAEGEYDLKSVSGDLKFVVPPETHCTAEMHTVSGDLLTSLPHDIIEKKRSRKRYAINGGGVLLSLNSVSGDMKILASGAEEPLKGPAVVGVEEATASTKPTPEAHTETRDESSETRMRILKAIEAGEITVEEGVQRLQELASQE